MTAADMPLPLVDSQTCPHVGSFTTICDIAMTVVTRFLFIKLCFILNSRICQCFLKHQFILLLHAFILTWSEVNVLFLSLLWAFDHYFTLWTFSLPRTVCMSAVVLQWFWEVVRSLTQEERVLLLQFVTGRFVCWISTVRLAVVYEYLLE